MNPTNDKNKSISFNSSHCWKKFLVIGIHFILSPEKVQSSSFPPPETVQSSSSLSCKGICDSQPIYVTNDNIKKTIKERINNIRNDPNFFHCLDTSNLTNMDDLFLKEESFNEDISCWEVSSVTSMDVSIYYFYCTLYIYKIRIICLLRLTFESIFYYFYRARLTVLLLSIMTYQVGMCLASQTSK